MKSDNINTLLQLCNNNIIRAIESGSSYETGIPACYFPFDDIRVTIIENDGDVVYDSEHDANYLDNHLSRPEVRSASATGAGYHIRRQSSSDGKQYFYSAGSSSKMTVSVLTKRISRDCSRGSIEWTKAAHAAREAQVWVWP